MRDGEMSVIATPKTPAQRLKSRLVMQSRTDALRMTWLRYFLRVVSAGYFAAFIPWITLILLNAPILAPGGALAPLLRFQPYNADYESMLVAINVVWALMLWRASNDPAKHRLFIDFTIWANAAHGLVMLIATPIQKGLPMTFVEGLPLFFVAAVLWWLRPVESPRRAPMSPDSRGTLQRTRRMSSQRTPRTGVNRRAADGGRAVVHRGRRLPLGVASGLQSISS